MNDSHEDKLVRLLTLIHDRDVSGRSIAETVALTEAPSVMAREIARILREDPSPSTVAAAADMLELLAGHSETTERVYAYAKEALEAFERKGPR